MPEPKPGESPRDTFLRMVETYVHPEADEDAYDDLISRAHEPEPDDREIIVFREELERLLRGDYTDLPAQQLWALTWYDETNDLEFLQRLWRDLYGDEQP